MIQALNVNFVGCMSRGKKKLNFIPHSRPGKDNDKTKNKIGKGALPIPSLRKWIKERQDKWQAENT